MLKSHSTYIFIIIIILGSSLESISQTCIFLGSGSGNGKNWNRSSNWSCGRVPDASSDDILIPAGRYVENNGNNDFSFDGGNTITIYGTLNMKNKKIEINNSSSSLIMGSAATLSNTKELFFNSGGTGEIETANVDVDHLKVDDNSELAINGRCVSINDKLENLSSAEISGSGCITYGGSDGDFVNSSSKGIFGCTESDPDDCTLDGLTSLPVELNEFYVYQESSIISFNWSTKSEVNNYGFTIEYLSERGWTDIGWTKGKGNSIEEELYTYETLGNYEHGSLFRLKQTDFDGTTSYSSTIALKTEEAPITNFSIYPNPAKSVVYIEGASNNTVNIYTSHGLFIGKVDLETNKGIDISQFPSGVLIFQSGITTKRIIKQ